MRITRRLLIGPLLGTLLLFGGARAESALAQQAVTVKLDPQNNSGVSGTATLTAQGDQTRVVVAVTGGGPGPMPAHIHAGTCANLTPTPAYPLTAIANGASDTVVNAKLADLQKSAMAINLHKSPQEAAVYVSCGNIPVVAAAAAPAPAAAPAAPAAAPVAQPAQLPRTGETAFGLLGLVGLGAAFVLIGGLVVRRRPS